MIFTVVSYIPLLEEETAHKKVEFAKKGQNSEGADGDDDETETEKQEYAGVDLLVLHSLQSTEYRHVKSFFNYASLLDDLNTPPPRI